MTLTFSREQDQFLESEVAAGRYSSIEEAVRDAVDRLRQSRAAAELREQLAEGLAELNRGEGIEIETDEDEERLFSELMAGLPESPTGT